MANTLEWGFYRYSHLAAERVTTIGAEVLHTAVQESARLYTEMINAMLATTVQRTTKYSMRYMLPGSGTLQPLTEDGSPKPSRVSGYYDVAFPMDEGGVGFGTNRVSRAKMTVEEASRQISAFMRGDADWMRRRI